MRKVLMLGIGLLVIIGLAYGAISTTQGESKVVNWVRGIYSVIESAGQEVTRNHSKIKDYIVNNPTHIETADKTKLSGLQTLVNTYQTSKQAVLDYIDIEFVGINE